MKVSPYLQSLTKLFIDLKDSYPRLSAYLSLYKDFPRVQNALCNFYAEIVSTCKHIILINNQKGMCLPLILVITDLIFLVKVSSI